MHTLDRLGRTVRDVLNLIHELAERKVGVRNLANQIKVDSSNPDDKPALTALRSISWVTADRALAPDFVPLFLTCLYHYQDRQGVPQLRLPKA